MLDVVSKTCIHHGCKIQPIFGLIDKMATHCVKHKSCEMTDVINKSCIHPGCKIQPNFGLYDKKQTHCSAHKSDKMTDVTSIKCKSCNLFGVKKPVITYVVTVALQHEAPRKRV